MPFNDTYILDLEKIMEVIKWLIKVLIVDNLNRI
jgi:hypothetical protein